MKLWFKRYWRYLLWVFVSLAPLVVMFLLKRKDSDALRKASGKTALDKANIDSAFLSGKREQLLSVLPDNHEKVAQIDGKLNEVNKNLSAAKLQVEGKTDEEILKALKDQGY